MHECIVQTETCLYLNRLFECSRVWQAKLFAAGQYMAVARLGARTTGAIQGLF